MKRALIAYLVILHLILAVCIYKGNFLQRGLIKLGFKQFVKEQTDFYYSMRLIHSTIDAQVQSGSVLFFGDSITQRMNVKKIHPKAVNFGIGTDKILGLTERLPHYKSLNTAAIVIVNIGVNDLYKHNSQYIIDKHQILFDKIPKGTKVIFTGILPVDEQTNRLMGYNKQINEVNSWLNTICKRNKNFTYIPLGHILTDNKGNLKHHFHDGDGLHLNSRAYNKINAYLKQKIEHIIYEKHDK